MLLLENCEPPSVGGREGGTLSLSPRARRALGPNGQKKKKAGQGKRFDRYFPLRKKAYSRGTTGMSQNKGTLEFWEETR